MEVPEDALPRTELLALRATDADSGAGNGEVRYSLEGPEGAAEFEVGDDDDCAGGNCYPTNIGGHQQSHASGHDTVVVIRVMGLAVGLPYNVFFSCTILTPALALGQPITKMTR